MDRENDTVSMISADPPSSPFQSEVASGDPVQASSPSPAKSRQSQRRSPTKTFEIHEDASEYASVSNSPVKSSNSHANARTATAPTPRKRPMGDSTLSDLREKIFVEQSSSKTPQQSEVISFEADDHDMPSMMSDDTCFSTFSAVPNADMTKFAKLGSRTAESTVRSPLRPMSRKQDFHTPSTSRKQSKLASSRSPSPTPRAAQQARQDGDTTNLLLDFTGHFDPSRSARPTPSRRGAGSPTKSTTEPNLLSYINSQRMPSPSKAGTTTPSNRKNLMHLLDFDLPPQPTPRSVPSISIRELESLKSQYLSEISSLKASLSGREAEVESLKKAVNDAERRVGEAQEHFRDERNAREHAEREKDAWEKKGHEVESVLKNVREEFMAADKEKEELLQKLEDSTRIREEAEMKLAEAHTKANVAQSEVEISADEKTQELNLSESEIGRRVNEQLDEKMECLARELHAVYKKKHESKVATLKKTYEARSDKKCNELQHKIDDMAKQVEDMQASKDATFSGEVPTALGRNGQTEERQRIEAQSGELEEHKAKLAGLAEEMKTMQQTQSRLMQELEGERVEKGELVAAVDEMLALQSEAGAPSAIEDFRKSISSRPPSSMGRGIPAPKASSIPAGKSSIINRIQGMGSSRGSR